MRCARHGLRIMEASKAAVYSYPSAQRPLRGQAARPWEAAPAVFRPCLRWTLRRGGGRLPSTAAGACKLTRTRKRGKRDRLLFFFYRAARRNGEDGPTVLDYLQQDERGRAEAVVAGAEGKTPEGPEASLTLFLVFLVVVLLGGRRCKAERITGGSQGPRRIIRKIASGRKRAVAR